MKRIVESISLMLFLSLVINHVYGTPSLNRSLTQDTQQNSSQSEQDELVKGELYLKFHTKFEEARKIQTTDDAASKIAYKEAYQIAKEYLQKFPKDDDDIAKYLKTVVGNYEAEVNRLKQEAARLEKERQRSERNQRFLDLLYKDKKYADAFALGKQILAEEPDDLTTLMNLTNVAYIAASTNQALRQDAINFTKKTIQLIEAGKTIEPGVPLPDKEKRLGTFYLSLGTLVRDVNPTEALTHFYKAAQNQETKKNPALYEQLAAIYQMVDYKRLSDEYNAKFLNKPETPESKAMLEKLNQVVDLIIDAYARAIAYSDGDPKLQQSRAAWMQQVSAYYKYRNKNSDVGLKELIASITSKPLPNRSATTIQ
jgi:hypothetical protein